MATVAPRARMKTSGLFRVEFKAVKGKENVVEGYASVFDVIDLHGDRIRAGAFKKTIAERVPARKVKFLDSHIYDIDHTLGTVVRAAEDSRGLQFEAELSTAPSVADRKIKMIEGHIDKTSIGYDIVRSEWLRDREADTDIQDLLELKLYEISAVPLPANEEADIVNVKTVVGFQDLPLYPREREWDADQAEARVRAWAEASEAPNEKYRDAFVWYDVENADQFGAYKLLVADVTDDRLAAVPGAIFAAAGAVGGARDGLDVPEADLAGIRAHLGRYYAKMRREFEDESIVAPWEGEDAKRRKVFPVKADLAEGVLRIEGEGYQATVGLDGPGSWTLSSKTSGAAGRRSAPPDPAGRKDETPPTRPDPLAAAKARAATIRADLIERRIR